MAEEAELDIDDATAETLLKDGDGDGTAPPEVKPRPEAEQLGDAGKKALDAMKLERNEAKKSLAAVQAKLKSIEDKDKSELQRLQEERDALKSSSDKATSQARAMQVAMDRAPEHATLAQVKAVAKRVRGDSEDELHTDADELFELLAPAQSTPKTPSRPKERLKGGSEPDEEVEEDDPRKLAALVKRRI
jgi:predicted  nucleic acid-binding Zn-ribbon protein